MTRKNVISHRLTSVREFYFLPRITRIRGYRCIQTIPGLGFCLFFVNEVDKNGERVRISFDIRFWISQVRMTIIFAKFTI